MSSVNSLAHLKIPLDDIKRATNDFSDENFIGFGGFGKVYKGSPGRNTVAVKRLDQIHGQGQREFLMEITTLSYYQHKNIVTLLGFCDEKDEMILVYEHEFNGSLNKHLSSIKLTWSQRLRICCGAACGLSYLHNPDGGLQRVLHRDIKSSNILLDHMGEAKISDFGLSKLGPANQKFTFLVTNAAGTVGYIDPLYHETSILTKESDVYSFGVVLFEVLCGRLCIVDDNDGGLFLPRLAKQCYKQNKIGDIIYDSIKKEMDPDSLVKFSTVAYKCLSKFRDERPTMAEVVKELEAALEFQEKRDANISGFQPVPSIFKRKYKLRRIAQLGDENGYFTCSIDFNCDDELFATTGATANGGVIKIYNFSKIVYESLVEHHPVVDIQTSSCPYGLSWNKNMKNHIASGDKEGTLTIWDVNNKQSVMEYKEHGGWVFSVDFSCKEPSLLVSGGMDHKVKIWRSNEKTSVATINIKDEVNSVKYNPGNSTHIVVAADNGCHYYDLRNTSHPLNIFPGLIKGVSNVRFLSDNELVSASRD